MNTKKRKDRRRQVFFHKLILILVIVLAILFTVFMIKRAGDKKQEKTESQTQTKTTSEKTNNKKEDKKEDIPIEERIKTAKETASEKGYPEDVFWLLDKNEETIDFVEDYAKKKDLPPADDIGDDYVQGEVPTLYQWDERWGYASYNSTVLARSGCGPTAMSMVLIRLTGDKTITPDKVAAYSESMGYTDKDYGTMWGFMKDAPANWNIQVKEGAPTDENWVKNMLDSGYPIIASMGPGNFTETGHFIVLTAYKDGYVTIHDPFRKSNTEKAWKYTDIYQQIKAMWAYAA